MCWRDRGVVGDWLEKGRLLVAIPGIEGARGVSHHLTWQAMIICNQYLEYLIPQISHVFEVKRVHCRGVFRNL